MNKSIDTLSKALGLAAAGIIYYFFGLWGLVTVISVAIIYHIIWRLKHGHWQTDDDL